MTLTVTVRLPKDLALWLKSTALRRGVSQSRIIRDHLESARTTAPSQAFMELAGAIRGPRDLSSRKGFNRK